MQQEESYIAAKCIIFSTLPGESSMCSPNLIHNDNGLGNTGFSMNSSPKSNLCTDLISDFTFRDHERRTLLQL